MISLDARAEVLEIEVASSNASAFALDVARDLETGDCLRNAEVRPMPGSSVTYIASGNENLVLVFEGSTYIRSDTRPGTIREGPMQLVLTNSDSGCAQTERVRLPVNGFASFGEVFAPTTRTGSDNLILLDAKLFVFGRSLERILWLIPIDWGPFSSNSLYPVMDLSLPAGTFIAHAVDKSEQSVQWWGYASFDPSATRHGLHVTVSTNADAVALYSPAPLAGSSTVSCLPKDKKEIGSRSAIGLLPDCLSVDLAAQLVGDPNLKRLYAFLVAIAAMATIAAFFRSKG